VLLLNSCPQTFRTSWRRNKLKQPLLLGPKPTGSVQLLPSRMRQIGILVGLLASIFRLADTLFDKINKHIVSHEQKAARP
jgi:hypothetical protein